MIGTSDQPTPADGRFAWDGFEAWIYPGDIRRINPRFWALTPFYFQFIPFVLADPGAMYEMLPEALPWARLAYQAMETPRLRHNYALMLGLRAAELDRHNNNAWRYELLREVVEVDSTIASIRGNYGLALIRIGKSQEALRHLEFAAMGMPDNSLAYESLVICYTQLNQYAAARRALDHLSQLQVPLSGQMTKLKARFESLEE